MPGDADELLADVFGVEDEIDATGGDGASRHGIVAGGIILGERDAALGFDRFQPGGAVTGGAGEDDADGTLALILGEGFEESINGASGAAVLIAGMELKDAFSNREAGVGRNGVNVVGFDAEIIGDLLDRHRRHPSEELRKGALVLGVEVLDEHKPHASVGRQMLQQLREGLQPAGGSADADEGERDLPWWSEPAGNLWFGRSFTGSVRLMNLLAISRLHLALDAGKRRLRYRIAIPGDHAAHKNVGPRESAYNKFRQHGAI